MEEREELQLGSLLHDAGKVLQRTGSVKLTSEERGLESTCCPVYQGRYSHTHALYTLKFFKDIWPDKFPVAENLAVFHHRPDTCPQSRLAKMVTLADRLASGERHSLDETAESGNPRTARLYCLFNTLKLENEKTGDGYFPLLPLSNDLEIHFPQSDSRLNQGESYDHLWKNLAKDLRNLNVDSEFDIFYEKVHQLLERYLLFVPSAAYRDRPDVSLFHHSKATAAIATCLYDAQLPEDKLDQILKALRNPGGNEHLKDQAMWLVGADLSGIQNFIFSVASKKALKGIRGRSVYLQLVAEAIGLRLLRELRLSCSNLIYCGGGHFYLLAPHTQDTVAKFREYQERIDKLLLRAHQGQLALCLAWEPLRFEDFLTPQTPKVKNAGAPGEKNDGGFAAAWQRLGARLARNKRQKFSSIFRKGNETARVLGPFPVDGLEKACDVCGEPITHTEEESGRCSFCRSFEQLANRVAGAESVRVDVSGASATPEKLNSYEGVMDGLGVRFRFLRSGQNDPEARLLNRLTPPDQTGSPQGFRFLAKHTPFSNSGEIKSLEDFADGADGIDKWGVLRADVDNLGRVFGDGLQGSDRSISRVSMLSYLLSLYFSAHVETLAGKPAYRDNVSVIYAGGDDLFAVGSWSVLVDFAQNIYKDFRTFSAGRLSLSAGIFLAPGKGYPIGQAGKLAGEEESRAKHQGKDRLGIFEQTIPWRDIRGLRSIEEKITQLIREGAPRSLLTFLYQAYELQSQAHRGELNMFPIWRVFYAFRRLTERQRKLAQPLMELEQMLIQDWSLAKSGPIAVRWADYLTRKSDHKEE